MNHRPYVVRLCTTDFCLVLTTTVQEMKKLIRLGIYNYHAVCAYPLSNVVRVSLLLDLILKLILLCFPLLSIKGGVFKLELFLPEEYPMAPPKVISLSAISHLMHYLV